MFLLLFSGTTSNAGRRYYYSYAVPSGTYYAFLSWFRSHRHRVSRYHSQCRVYGTSSVCNDSSVSDAGRVGRA